MLASPAATKPKVLFIFNDDHRWDTVHAPGNQHIHTPNHDRLAEHGCRFNNAQYMGSTRDVDNGPFVLAAKLIFSFLVTMNMNHRISNPLVHLAVSAILNSSQLAPPNSLKK